LASWNQIQVASLSDTEYRHEKPNLGNLRDVELCFWYAAGGSV
jgi:hypothetical protein